MPVRFQRRFTIVPGVRVNLGKRRASVSVGRRGAWATFGPRGSKASIGPPGTGLRWTTSDRAVNGWGRWWLILIALAVLAHIGSHSG
jgi:hypothetical protein